MFEAHCVDSWVLTNAIVGGHDQPDSWIELRVLGPAEVRPVSVYDESDVMLDPWDEFPQPTPMFSVTGEFGSTPLPDVPEMGTEIDLRPTGL